MTATCSICGLTFACRTSYGLCSACLNATTLREYDRLTSATRAAQRAKLPTGLTLVAWLATISDHKGLCAYCQEYQHSYIEMVDPAHGLVYDNCVTSCRACHQHARYGFHAATRRVLAYLSGERVCDEGEELTYDQS